MSRSQRSKPINEKITEKEKDFKFQIKDPTETDETPKKSLLDVIVETFQKVGKVRITTENVLNSQMIE